MLETIHCTALSSKGPSKSNFYPVTRTHHLFLHWKRLQLCTESYLQRQQPSLHTESHGFRERRRTSEHEVTCICMRKREAISVTSNQWGERIQTGEICISIYACNYLEEKGSGHAIIKITIKTEIGIDKAGKKKNLRKHNCSLVVSRAWIMRRRIWVSSIHIVAGYWILRARVVSRNIIVSSSR